MHESNTRGTLIEREEVVAQLVAGLLGAGSSTLDTITRGQSAALALGLKDPCFVDLGRSIMVQHEHPEGQVRTVSRPVGLDNVNCEQLRALTQVCEKIDAAELNVQTAPAAIRAATSITTAWWQAPVGLTILAFCIALQVGGHLLTAVGAVIVQVSVSAVGWATGRMGLPRLFSVALQCMLCAAMAAILVAVEWTSSPGAVAIAVAWMLLVPQPQIVNTVVDAINTLQLAALARLASIIVVVGGIALGGAVVILLGRRYVEVTPDLTLPTLALPLALLFSVIGAMANAIANGGRATLLWPAALIGLLTAVCNQTLTRGLHMQTAWAAGLSAVLLGFVATLLARRSSYPASVLALMGLTAALLPGLTVYLGLATSLTGGSGLTEYLHAGLTCLGLGVGVALGFTLAQWCLPGRKSSVILG